MKVFLLIMLMISPDTFEIEAITELDSIESCVEASLVINNDLSIPQFAFCGVESAPSSETKPDIVS